MFQKVLIAEDIDVINKGIHANLSEMGITNIVQVQYCDDAYLKIRRGMIDKMPYDLFITDLSFISDHREQEFKSGEDLIKIIKQECPDLKVIVYSIDNRLQKVRDLFYNSKIDAYVCKSRKGLFELTKAIEKVSRNKHYLSPEVANALKNSANISIDDFDIQLVKQLALGFSQSEISAQFAEQSISPNSLSTIEKRINNLKDLFKANNTTHLIAIVKDLGLI